MKETRVVVIDDRPIVCELTCSDASAPGTSEADDQGRAVAKSAPPLELRRGRLLLVDDDRAILSLLQRALGREHDCSAVEMASDALACFAAGERFDVILCDLMMPLMSGMDLFAELLRVAPEQAGRVVFLTGGAFTPKLQSFLLDVPNECIHKPFDISKLKASVRARVRP